VGQTGSLNGDGFSGHRPDEDCCLPFFSLLLPGFVPPICGHQTQEVVMQLSQQLS